MQFDVESNVLHKNNDFSELVILGYSDRDETGGSSMYYNQPELTIKFFDGYARFFTDSGEMTGNFGRMWFIDGIDNSPTGSRVHMIGRSRWEMYTPAGTVTFTPESSAANCDFSTVSYEPGTFKSIENMIKHCAKMNGIYVDRETEEELSFSDLLMLYAFPLLRENYVKGMSFLNLKGICDNNMGSYLSWGLDGNDGISTIDDKYDNKLDFLYCKTMKDAVAKCLKGRHSKKIINILSKQSPLIVTKRTQGFSKVDKNGIATKQELNVEILTFVKFLSLHLTIDHIQTVLESIKPDQTIHSLPSGLFYTNHELLRLYPKSRLVKLFSNTLYIGLLSDAMRQFAKYSDPKDIPRQLRDIYPNGMPLPKKPKNWKEVHDRISKHYNEIKAAEKNIPFEYTPEEFQLHRAEKDNIMIKLPSSGKDVVGWGKKFGHCIASYVEKHDERRCMLFGVYVDGVLMYNAEFRSNNTYSTAAGCIDGSVPAKDELKEWKFQQCRGKDNNIAPIVVIEAVKQLVFPVLTRLGLEEPLVANG